VTASTQSVDPFDLVIFGGTGDLALRKLLPALFHRFLDGQIPGSSRIVGIARETLDDAGYRAQLREALIGICDARQLDVFLQQVFYRPLDARKDEGWDDFAAFIGSAPEHVRVFYLSTSPELFVDICTRLGHYKLNEGASRVVLEKPIGRDLASANQINDAVGKVFSESQTFRIDHYLGKETVQNLLVLRFGNALFEPLWRRESIANIQITLTEQLGVGTRADFYDRTGALRDMIQNHALQLLTMIAMEPPSRNHADAIRDEKLKVLEALKPFTEESVLRDVVRGQYRRGTVDGKAAPGYLEEPDAPPDSRIETFVALRTEVQNWRWAGVPFYLRTGKCLAAYEAHIVVNFRPTPHIIFPGSNTPNKLVIKLQPEDGLELHLMAAKGSGQSEALSPVFLDLDFDKAFAENRVDAYERLLLEAIAGRLNLFVRSDEQEQAWRWVEPILRTWVHRNDITGGPRPYAAGTWGPAAASALVARDGFAWPEEQ
jgi:glucose-6-phosphate 1-dehydrogenase